MDNKYIQPLVDELAGRGDAETTEPRNELEHFQQQWQEELGRRAMQMCHRGTAQQNRRVDNKFDIEEQAKLFFLQGVKAEQCGALYEAIKFYRHAMQLVPDIESKIDYDMMKTPRVRQESESSTSSLDSELDDEDLVSRFTRLQMKKRVICNYVTEQKSVHISALPVEVLNYIFRWVVSSELDMKALENLSEVCRGFYMCARDDELWRLACLSVWGVNCGWRKKYGSWRNMYIERPHLHFNGCYISRTSYVRQGEKSLDIFYRPWHIVEYYRYVRFFPNGVMLMMTSPEDPLTTLPRFKSQKCYIQGMLHGFYRLSGDQVTGVLRRVRTLDFSNPYQRYKRQNFENDENEGEQTFHVEYTVTSIGKRSCVKLMWNKYCIETKYRSGDISETNFELNSMSYPPIIFSRVKSYTAVTEEPLGSYIN